MPSYYEITVPVFIKNLKVLIDLLKKGSEHSAVSNEKLFNSRLIDDMGGLSFQIQLITQFSAWFAQHIAKKSPPAFENNEKTYEDLFTRINATIEILETVKESDFVAEDSVVNFEIKGNKISYKAKEYILEFAYPNFYFHFVTAYNLLRKEGVQIGKKDFLGKQ